MSLCLLVCGGPCGQSTFVTSQCHWDLRGLGGKCVCVAPCHWGARNMLAQTWRVAGERGDWPSHVTLVCGQTVWPKYVRDVAVPWGFARKCVCVAPCHWGARRWRKRGVECWKHCCKDCCIQSIVVYCAYIICFRL